MIKTLILYLIMVTGAVWEKVVFGQYLFAKPFFWEDVFSMLVLALHTAYLFALFGGSASPSHLMSIALAAYVTYVINAGQFVWKLRLARLQAALPRPMATPRQPLTGLHRHNPQRREVAYEQPVRSGVRPEIR